MPHETQSGATTDRGDAPQVSAEPVETPEAAPSRKRPGDDGYCPDCGGGACYCDEEARCHTCGGDGIVGGDEIAGSYDYGWIDPEKFYDCTNCGGSGLAKDCTSW